MIKKLTTTFMMAAIVATANMFAFASGNDGATDKSPVKTARTEEKREARNWSAILAVPQSKSFDPTSMKSTMSEHQAQKKAAKRFSTTTKVLIGVGIAAAVIAIVFVAARDDLKDDLLK